MYLLSRALDHTRNRFTGTDRTSQPGIYSNTEKKMFIRQFLKDEVSTFRSLQPKVLPKVLNSRFYS